MHSSIQTKGNTMAADNSTDYRELAQRASDGVEVTLYWHETRAELTVRVSDQRGGASFELAADPDQALDVFYHPFSYAASRGVASSDVLLAA
jgi:phosphopantothenate synthetase